MILIVLFAAAVVLEANLIFIFRMNITCNSRGKHIG